MQRRSAPSRFSQRLVFLLGFVLLVASEAKCRTDADCDSTRRSGTCTNLALVNGTQSGTCHCIGARWEDDGTPSGSAADPTCARTLQDQHPEFTLYYRVLALLGFGAQFYVSFSGLLAVRSVRRMGVNVPTVGLLCYALAGLTEFLYFAIDPFREHGILSDVGDTLMGLGPSVFPFITMNLLLLHWGGLTSRFLRGKPLLDKTTLIGIGVASGTLFIIVLLILDTPSLVSIVLVVAIVYCACNPLVAIYLIASFDRKLDIGIFAYASPLAWLWACLCCCCVPRAAAVSRNRVYVAPAAPSAGIDEDAELGRVVNATDSGAQGQGQAQAQAQAQGHNLQEQDGADSLVLSGTRSSMRRSLGSWAATLTPELHAGMRGIGRLYVRVAIGTIVLYTYFGVMTMWMPARALDLLFMRAVGSCLSVHNSVTGSCMLWPTIRKDLIPARAASATTKVTSWSSPHEQSQPAPARGLGSGARSGLASWASGSPGDRDPQSQVTQRLPRRPVAYPDHDAYFYTDCCFGQLWPCLCPCGTRRLIQLVRLHTEYLLHELPLEFATSPAVPPASSSEGPTRAGAASAQSLPSNSALADMADMAPGSVWGMSMLSQGELTRTGLAAPAQSLMIQAQARTHAVSTMGQSLESGGLHTCNETGPNLHSVPAPFADSHEQNSRAFSC